jgi:hypothetical protein
MTIRSIRIEKYLKTSKNRETDSVPVFPASPLLLLRECLVGWALAKFGTWSDLICSKRKRGQCPPYKWIFPRTDSFPVLFLIPSGARIATNHSETGLCI